MTVINTHEFYTKIYGILIGQKFVPKFFNFVIRMTDTENVKLIDYLSSSF